MPHSVASDLGLHCLPVSNLWDSSTNGLTNNKDPDEKAHNEPSHLDLHFPFGVDF